MTVLTVGSSPVATAPARTVDATKIYGRGPQLALPAGPPSARYCKP
jgi:hypothetical protein